MNAHTREEVVACSCCVINLTDMLLYRKNNATSASISASESYRFGSPPEGKMRVGESGKVGFLIGRHRELVADGSIIGIRSNRCHASIGFVWTGGGRKVG